MAVLARRAAIGPADGYVETALLGVFSLSELLSRAPSPAFFIGVDGESVDRIFATLVGDFVSAVHVVLAPLCRRLVPRVRMPFALRRHGAAQPHGVVLHRRCA